MVIASIAVTISWRLLQRMLVLINWGSRANARDLSASAGRPGHGDFARLWRYHSDPRIPLITAIFPITAAAAMQIGEALHQLDAHDVKYHAIAVVLDLMRPAVARRRFLDQLAALGFDEGRKRCGGMGREWRPGPPPAESPY